MSAGIYNLEIHQNETFTRTFTLRDQANALVNLTGYSAAMSMRRRLADPVEALRLTDTNGRIVLGGTNGTVTIALSSADTASLTTGGVYDLRLTAPGINGDVTYPFEGEYRLQLAVTP